MRGALALVCALACIITVGFPAAASAADQEIVFVATVSELGMTLTLRADVTYTDAFRVEVGDQVDVLYELEPTGGTIHFVVPLSSMSFGIINDCPVDIPVPVSPLGTASFNVLSLIPFIPFGIATLDLVVEGEVQASSCACTLGTATISTPASTLQWQDAGEHTVTVSSSLVPEVSTIRTALVYALSVGLKATILGADLWIVDPVAVSSTSGTPVLETTIETYEPASILAYVVGGVVAAAVAASIIGFFILKRRD